MMCSNCKILIDIKDLSTGAYCSRCNTWNSLTKNCSSSCQSCYQKAVTKSTDINGNLCQNDTNDLKLNWWVKIFNLIKLKIPKF